MFYEQENQLDDTSKESSSDGDTITNKINVDDGNKRRKLNNSNADSSDANSVKPNESYSEENVGIPSKIEEEIELDKINGGWENKGIMDLRIVPGVGCEKFAELIHTTLSEMLHADKKKSLNPTVKLKSVEVFEHGANSAIYEE